MSRYVAKGLRAVKGTAGVRLTVGVDEDTEKRVNRAARLAKMTAPDWLRAAILAALGD